MSSQVSQECPCPPHRSDSSPDVLSQEQVGEYLSKLENYKRVDSAIERLYTFKGFRGAVKFINAVADECVKHNVSLKPMAAGTANSRILAPSDYHKHVWPRQA